jgi:hypothetical protein
MAYSEATGDRSFPALLGYIELGNYQNKTTNQEGARRCWVGTQIRSV